MNGQGTNGLCDWGNESPLVVGELKLVQVISEKLLSVDGCEVEIIWGWGIIRCCRAHEAFEVINCVIVGGQKEKF